MQFLIKRRSVGPGKEQAEMSLLITLLSGIVNFPPSPMPWNMSYLRLGCGGGGGGGGGGGRGGGGGGGAVGVDESQLSCKRINILTVIGVVLAESGVLIYVWIKIN